jgi:4-amino-4-deoxy-L-arabinose transferase-like glycosyltransferase
MENALLLIIVIGLLAYQTALARGSWPWFVVAGLVLGFAVAFKQSGAYILLAVALCWLILRRRHKGHLLMLGSAVAVVAAYIAVMIRLYDIPGNDWYLQESLVQIRRVLALQPSGGTLTSPTAFVHLISTQYRVFLPSLLMALAACALAARRLWQCYRARGWQPLRGNALLFGWLAAGIVVFGVSALRFPQYFELILVPLYCFLWTEIHWWRWPASRKVALIAVAAAAGLGSFYLRVLTPNDQVFTQVQRYAATAIPRNGLVVTEEAFGDLIQQPWCRVEAAKPCVGSATYAITWQTYLQSSFKLGGPAFHHLMRGAVPIKSFNGFNGSATVWRLK